MIIRKYAACEECGTDHVLRIGLGNEPVEQHHFACSHCGSEMGLTLEQGVGIRFGPNAIEVDPNDSAAVINLHPDFLFGQAERSDPKFFASLEMGARMVQNMLAARRAAGLSEDFSDAEKAAPPPAAIGFEWEALRAAWSLHRNGKDKLAVARRERFQKANPLPEAPDGLPDWLFMFTQRLAGFAFEPMFEGLFQVLRQAMESADFERFLGYFDAELSRSHGRRYFELMKAYLNHFSEFSQAHSAVNFGVKVADTAVAGSTDFDRTRMVYGDAFETFASNVELLAMLNNLVVGRSFDQFETMTLDDYHRIDKAGRVRAFSAHPALAAAAAEFDNQLRNASHHNGMEFDRKTGIIHYRSGKGGQGEVKTLGYGNYLARTATLFIQTMLLFRLELLIADRFKRRPPL
ncbi:MULTISPECIES: hypothetical protein [Sphingomonas]|uniref:hypothetical protein n=1 Tax=Sphingomonas TaxID=13687 RepID=UPI001269907A|nr:MULTISPECIES: hypothetical protein [Sphingomonas]